MMHLNKYEHCMFKIKTAICKSMNNTNLCQATDYDLLMMNYISVYVTVFTLFYVLDGFKSARASHFKIRVPVFSGLFIIKSPA